MAILFSNATVLPMTAVGNAPRTFAGWVGVDGNRIALVTESETAAAEFRAAHPGLREFDCRGKLVMPGLVNTHCHAAMTLQRSLADDIALMEWLHDYIWPFEARQTADDVALGMTLGVVEMLLGGVTSFVDMYYFENRCVETVERLGIRAMLGCNYFDSNVDEVMPQVEEAVRLAAGCDRVQIALAPHSPYTVSPENLLRGKRLADKYGLHLMTHISETQDEVRIVREKLRLVARTEKTGHPRRVFNNVPTVVRHFHFHQYVTGKELAFGIDSGAFFDFNDIFGRDHHFQNFIFHVFQNRLFAQRFGNLFFRTGINVYNVPMSSHCQLSPNQKSI